MNAGKSQGHLLPSAPIPLAIVPPPPPARRERGPGERCAVCGWKRCEGSDDALIRCGWVEQSGQRDMLTGEVESLRDALHWCERFHWYTVRGD